jgi:hypothetical protein
MNVTFMTACEQSGIDESTKQDKAKKKFLQKFMPL